MRPALALKIKPQSNTFVFIVCTLIALTFWFLKSLEQTYKTEVNFPIQYENFPENRILKDSLPDKVRLEIKGSGWDILSIKTSSEVYPLMIDLINTSANEQITLEQNAFFPEGKVPEDIEVMDFYPDTLNIDFDKKTEKTVKVSLNGTINYMDHHGLADSIKILPEKVHLEGPKSYLKKIDSVSTRPFQLENLKQKIVRTIPLADPSYPFVEYNKKAIKLIVPVEQLTEGQVKLPVKLDNPYFNSRIELIPKQVRVIFQTALSNYPSISRKDFQAKVSTNFITQEERPNTLKVRLMKKPEFIYNVRIEPSRVNYLLQNVEE